VRRLILVLTAVAVAGLLVYRRRTLEHWEHELAIGSLPGETPGH
jgi:hypothetical protein